MRFCIDFGTQNGSTIVSKSVQNFRFSGLGVSIAFLRSPVASCHLFCIVGCSADLHFSWENTMFLRFVHLATDRVRATSRRFFSFPSLEKSTKNLAKLVPEPSKKQRRNHNRFWIDFWTQNASKIEAKIDQKSSKRDATLWPDRVFRAAIGPIFHFGGSEVDFTPTGSASGPILDPLWHRFWNPRSILGPILESSVHFGTDFGTQGPFWNRCCRFESNFHTLGPPWVGFWIPRGHFRNDFGTNLVLAPLTR